MNSNTWKIKSNLKTHGYTFAVKAEYNRLKASGVSNVYCVDLAVQNVKRVIKTNA